MKKKIVFCVCALTGISIILYIGIEIFQTWEETPVFRNIARVFALLGWISITRDMLTFKYKWIKRLIK
ncbi:hypothetical protein [Bacteroides heparinolyticus]|uniref:hypothetical protein n=1 Tax=Prevotella heparinolytica TaxID=28113 RepID=UPI003F9EE4FA